jgi:hypothetical protein
VTPFTATITLLVAMITATGLIIAALIGNRREATSKLDEIHLLVDGRLDQALKEIVDLKKLLVTARAAEAEPPEPA